MPVLIKHSFDNVIKISGNNEYNKKKSFLSFMEISKNVESGDSTKSNFTVKYTFKHLTIHKYL